MLDKFYYKVYDKDRVLGWFEVHETDEVIRVFDQLGDMETKPFIYLTDEEAIIVKLGLPTRYELKEELLLYDIKLRKGYESQLWDRKRFLEERNIIPGKKLALLSNSVNKILQDLPEAYELVRNIVGYD